MPGKGQVKDKTGMCGTSKEGMTIKIVAYRGTHDLDVAFPDGQVVTSSFHKFSHQMISHPDSKRTCAAEEKSKQQAKERLGETRMMLCGMNATIIRYANYADIDVEFEDGHISTHKQYICFQKGNIENPNLKLNREGEVGQSKAGQKMTIIKYKGCNDITVEFEDGTVIEHVFYKSFVKGNIRNPNFKKQKEIGRKAVMKNGQEAEIIAYRGTNDISVRFEDGTVVEGESVGHFNSGYIKNPNYQKILHEDRIGEEHIQSCGLDAKIIAYRSASDMDVEFEDGNVVKNVKYKSFLLGYIKHPFIRTSNAAKIMGESKKMANGMLGTIVDVVTLGDIAVRFEDGTVVYHKKYYDFLNGKIGHPDVNANKLQCIGEKRRMNCGMDATIIRYETWMDMDVQFDDGEIVHNTNRSSFTKGSIAHPIVTRGNFVYKGFIAKRAFADNQDVYYKCRCTKCNYEDILTLYQMMNNRHPCGKYPSYGSGII